jgi:hypothetical protein
MNWNKTTMRNKIGRGFLQRIQDIVRSLHKDIFSHKHHEHSGSIACNQIDRLMSGGALVSSCLYNTSCVFFAYANARVLDP